MSKLNSKQREEFSKSLIKLAEYIVLTLVIGQVALGRFNIYIFSLFALVTIVLYFTALFILRNYKEVD
jgi:hypothetical protein